MAGEISVGAEAITRDATVAQQRTVIMGVLPANLDGFLTDVELKTSSPQDGDSFVGIFKLVSGTTFRCRSAQNLGVVPQGYSKQALSPILAIREGDFIGWYGADSADTLFCDSGEAQVYYLAGNHCAVDDENEYALWGNKRWLSLHGIGDHVPIGEFAIVV